MLSYLGKIDPLILTWSVVIIVMSLASAGYAIFRCVRACRELNQLIDRSAALPTLSPEDRQDGQSLAVTLRLFEVAKSLSPRAKAMWHGVESVTEKYTSPYGKDGWFVTRPLEEVLPADPVVQGYYPAHGLHNVPGIVTSLGLLGTFVALLLGLMGLEVNSAGAVVGIGDLINNLSGKFLTSIVALACGVLVLVLDLYVLQPRILVRRLRVIDALNGILPHLTQSRILLDIQRFSVKQSTSLSNISSEFIGAFTQLFHADLAPLFAQGISKSMAVELQVELGPTLERLTGTMTELAGTVQRLESSKQESVVGELRGLTESLERSLRTTLTEMGEHFREALSGSTKDEFGKLAGVVSGSAEVLQAMTSSFGSMEATLKAIVSEARTSTSAQLEASVEQTTRLNQLVEGLMLRLNEAASQNFESIGAALTTVVTRLSEKVGSLSADMVSAVQAAAERSQQSASSTLEKAGSWSDKTGAQLTELLHALKAKSEEFELAGQTLLSAEAVLARTLSQNEKALQALGSAAGEVRTYTTGLSGLQREVSEGHRLQLNVATLARQSVADLKEAAENHGELLERYRSTFEQQQRLLTGLDAELDKTLSTIMKQMDAFTEGVEQSFTAIMKTSNQHFPTIAATLQDANDRLREQLDELTEVLSDRVTKLRDK